MSVRYRLAVLASALVAGACLLIWALQPAKRVAQSATLVAPAQSSAVAVSSSAASASTSIHAHNLLLRKGPAFRVYIPWLNGQITRTRRDVNPSFDDPDSFVLDVKAGVIHANIGDIGNFLNAGGVAKSPLKDIRLSGDGDQLKVNGTVHKLIPLPIEMTGTISAAADNRIQVHVTKLSILKIPFKGLLGGFHVSVSDLFHPAGIEGIEVSGNDIFFNTQKLLPAPHIRGKLTRVRIVNPDLEEVYGDAASEITRVEQWRNFLRLSDGTLDFGKLTMHHVDLIMIDISDDAWFDLDLAQYQEQLVNGYTRMTPQAGLQIFMPDLGQIPQNKRKQNTNVEWLKNRNAPPPPDVVSK